MTRPRSFAEAVELRAHAAPDGELIRLVGGTALGAGELLDRAIGLAGSLASVAAAGDIVATAVPSGPEAAALTTAISWLGAVELPLPDGLDPAVARTLASSTRCVTAVVAPERLIAEQHLAALGAHPGRPVLTIGGRLAGIPHVDDLPARPTPAHRADLDAPAAVMVTSGTGGRPKGALLPNGAGLGQAERVRRAMDYDVHDVLLNIFAVQHVNARHAAFLPAVLSGARLVVDTFSVSRFWATVAREDVTAFNFMGAVCAMLLRQPAAPADRLHSVRQAYGGPAPTWLYAQVLERFGIELRQAYACTELGDVATTGRDVPGAAGRVVPEYDLRVVDELGAPLGDGSTGTVQVRPTRPGLTFTEYVGDADATRAAWSDGWFVTGDRGRLHDGWFHHEGRAADVIRRRGLTIDAERLERVGMGHPDVEQAAAVGVPSELTDDDVLLVVVPRPDSQPDPADVRRHCAAQLPRHAVPRFVSIETSLPLTGSLKIIHRGAARPPPAPDRLGRRGVRALPGEPVTTTPLRVLDLTDPLGRQGARLFVGLGADVVRIALDSEPTTGAEALHWHAGKRLLSVPDLDQLDAAVEALVERADVVLESGPSAGLRTLALREACPEAWAHAAHVVVTPFGLTGPHRDWLGDDTVLTAAGGMAWLGGDPGHAPEPPPREQGVQLAGTHGAIGALLALNARHRTGAGQLVEVSAQEAVAATLETGAIAWIHGRTVPGRSSGVYGHVAHRVFRAADGYLAGGYSGSPRMWDDLLAWMVEEGEAGDLADEQWQDVDVRWAGRPHVDEVVSRFVAHHPAGPFADEARRRGLPWAEVASGAALLENPQLLARQFFVGIEGPEGLRDVGLGWEPAAAPRPVTIAPPQPVELSQVWPEPQSHDRPQTRRRPHVERGAALDGVRVLDLTWVLAGPYVTRTLADHGAEIVKVESFHRKDPTRFAPGMRLRPEAGIDGGGYFVNFNRNKRSLALNLRTNEGQQLLRRLVPHVDVVVENFSPGVLSKWGLDYPRLRELNPGVVLVSMAGAGQDGPWRDAVTFADTLAAMSGLTAETGRANRAPQGLTFGLGDMVAANSAVVATLDLLSRGAGGHVDLSQLEAMASHLGSALLQSQLPPEPPSRAVARIVRAAGDDRWLAVGAVAPDVLRAALGELGVAADAAEPLDDLERHSEGADAETLAERLQALGIPAHPVRDGRALVEHDAQLAARGFYPVLEHPLAGPVPVEGIVPRLSGTPGGLWEAAPLLGQHTDVLLTELLGLTPDELADLHEQGVLS